MAGDDFDDVSRAKLCAGDLFDLAILADAMREGFGLGTSQCIRLCLAAALRHGFGKVREQHREPEPQGNLQIEAELRWVMDSVVDEKERGKDAADFNDEHDRIAHHGLWVQLAEGVGDTHRA